MNCFRFFFNIKIYGDQLLTSNFSFSSTDPSTVLTIRCERWTTEQTSREEEKPRGITRDKLTRFLEDDTVGFETNILEWWNVLGKKQYLTLAKMTRDWLALLFHVSVFFQTLVTLLRIKELPYLQKLSKLCFVSIYGCS
ncbi:hypothetical protein P9112_009689 [Eukaryota sp. TZLM1-RC]